MDNHIEWLRSQQNNYNKLIKLPIREDIVRYIWLRFRFPPIVQRQNANRPRYSGSIISSMLKYGAIFFIITMIIYNHGDYL